jgi:ubiquinone/menaquinone biosynthesis C-methylase UbiE
MSKNIDKQVVSDFGREWSSFDQNEASEKDLQDMFNDFFSLFPWEKINTESEGFDLGCGSGRWAYFCAPKVGKLHCIEPAESALEVARKKLSVFTNCVFHNNSVDEIPLEDNTMDFGYSLGVLHHIPDTLEGIKCCVKKIKPGAPFLLYLYYMFDDKPLWFRGIWYLSHLLRQIICKMPYPLKYVICQLIAIGVYFPLSRFALICEKMGMNVENIPLCWYRNKKLYTLRTDALDRFSTRLERRFTKKQITEMMQEAGLENISFRNQRPFHCAIGYKVITK